MATVVQQHRGTTAQHATYVGPEGSITVDIDKDVVVVHDGVTAGGHPMAADKNVVHTTGDETVNGTKTFSSSPQVPSVDAFDVSTNAASTKQVDDALQTMVVRVDKLPTDSAALAALKAKLRHNAIVWALEESSSGGSLEEVMDAVSASDVKAAEALSLATEAKTVAGTAQQTAETGVANAATAQSTADSKLGKTETAAAAAKLANARTVALSGEVSGTAAFDGSEDVSITAAVTGIDASKITSGTIDVARLPAASLERLVAVADLNALLALTTDSVQVGDTIQVEASVTVGGSTYPAGSMFRVVDQSVFTGSQTADSVTAGIKPYVAGSAAQAAQLATARTIAITGGATGTATSFNGTADISIPVTALDAGVVTAGVLSVDHGGTGLDASPSMLVNLGSTTAAGVLQEAPRPGVTGILPVANGGTGNATGLAASATKLATARNISVTGDVSGSASFDGTANAAITATLANSGVTAGSYGPTSNVSPAHGGSFVVPQITVDAKGRTTAVTARTVNLPAATVLNNTVTSTSTTEAATANAVKQAYDRASTAIANAATAQSTANGKWTAVDASTTVKGIVQLSSATNSTSTALAATASAVKSAYDRASTAITNAATAQTAATNAQNTANGKWTAVDASTSAKGIVQLSTATNSTSTALAATASAVKAAYDRASTAITNAASAQTTANSKLGLPNYGAATNLGSIDQGGSVSPPSAGYVLAEETSGNGGGIRVNGILVIPGVVTPVAGGETIEVDGGVMGTYVDVYFIPANG